MAMKKSIGRTLAHIDVAANSSVRIHKDFFNTHRVYHYLSHLEIRGAKRISQHLSGPETFRRLAGAQLPITRLAGSYIDNAQLCGRVDTCHESAVENERLTCHERRPVRAHPQDAFRDFLRRSKSPDGMQTEGELPKPRPGK